MGDKVLGAFGQHILLPARVARQNLFHRPREVSAELAAMLEPAACVIHSLESIDWKGVDRVLVLGLGAMGLLFAQLLPRYTRASCEGAGRRRDRVEMARNWGLSPVYDLTEATLADLAPGERYDVVIECTGKMDGWKEAFHRAAPGGQVLFFGGLPRGTAFPLDTYRTHYEEVTVRGSFHFSPRDVALAREQILSRAIDTAGLISGTMPLDGVQEAMERLSAGQGVQYAIDPWG
jgi:L-iditol 2-dehydrogenase